MLTVGGCFTSTWMTMRSPTVAIAGTAVVLRVLVSFRIDDQTSFSFRCTYRLRSYSFSL